MLKPYLLYRDLKGIGYNAATGIEYLVSRRIGIGVNFGYVGYVYLNEKLTTEEKHEYDVIENFKHLQRRIYLDAGLRIHF